MPTATNRQIYSYRINDYATPSGWTTANLFDAGFVEPKESPIDTFSKKLGELNKIILDPRDLKTHLDNLLGAGSLTTGQYENILGHITNFASINPVHANLILLGYISAVESYFREIIRRIILVDEIAKQSCELELIAFGAALFHESNMLPEALLENTSFINKKLIKDVLRQFLGITTVGFPIPLEESLSEFENVCQLRHCIVHRFGKLGANNAIKLGLSIHGAFIEKPIKLNYAAIQNVAQVCFNVVKEVNQFLWQVIMMRQIGEPLNNKDWKKKTTATKWTWDLRKDRKLFRVYFDIFTSTSGVLNPDVNTAYNELRNRYNTLP